ncbi:MAG: hypothetical protein M5U13_01890 [Thermoanaerobaculia bacterium]|nr:hypothetical protein [Thermoanaerobaculia bacterium]
MLRIPRRLLGIACAAALLGLPALAADSRPGFELRIAGDGGEQVRIEVGSSWLAALVREAVFECQASDDPETREMAESLDRQGEGGVHRFTADDGDRVTARRRHGQLVLQVVDRKGERATVEMPWAFAECWMLGRAPAGKTARDLVGDGFSLQVDGRDGRERVRISVD